jgi:ring-1,2-phenylacetyl-CoA epoxidase subunit PaaE
MGLFNFKKKKSKTPRGFYEIKIKQVRRLTAESVQIVLDIPENLQDTFHFIPGQYLNFSITLNGTEYRRSYSICSGTLEDLAIAVKAIDKGIISNWFNSEVKEGQMILVGAPEGSFKLKDEHKNVVAFAGGSGITPMVSIAKKLQETGGEMHLVYGNLNEEATIFKNELDNLSAVDVRYFYVESEKEGDRTGLLDRENVANYIKEDLTILKADAFFLCGPLPMIEGVEEQLLLFGVTKDKIKKELFTSPAPLKEVDTSATEVASSVTVILDGETIPLQYKPKGKGILEQLNSEGYDPPYSCRGGVCSSCKSKVLEGSAIMKLNYSLTDEEVAEGYILCCQAVPTSDKVTISFDE